MIASVSGIVSAVGTDTAVVEVGGVGLAVHCVPAALAGLRTGEPVRLATALVVREDSLTLYGFADDDERAVFETLQGVSGIGPRTALAVLAVHSPDALRRAVATEDIAALTLVPGIGRKGAQRLVLELRDSLGAPAGVPATLTLPPSGGWRDQLREALSGLGWGPREVEQALTALAPDADAAGKDPDLAGLLRASLQLLSRT
jgi:holliday junction DNA helicase RuvA